MVMFPLKMVMFLLKMVIFPSISPPLGDLSSAPARPPHRRRRRSSARAPGNGRAGRAPPNDLRGAAGGEISSGCQPRDFQIYSIVWSSMVQYSLVCNGMAWNGMEWNAMQCMYVRTDGCS